MNLNLDEDQIGMILHCLDREQKQLSGYGKATTFCKADEMEREADSLRELETYIAESTI